MREKPSMSVNITVISRRSPPTPVLGGRPHDLPHEILGHVVPEHLEAFAHALDRLGQPQHLGDAARHRHLVGEIEVADALSLDRKTPPMRARKQQRDQQSRQDGEANRRARHEDSPLDQDPGRSREFLERHSRGNREGRP